jgi:hypothetical protein
MENSYTFSKYFSSWGWATWANRWKLFDSEMSEWPNRRMTTFLRRWSESPMESVYWESVFESVYKRAQPLSEAWDYAVQFTMWLNDMVAVRPSVNLVQNTGMGVGATHTRVDSPAVSGREVRPMRWPLRHPTTIDRDCSLDSRVNEVRLGGALRNLVRERSRVSSEPPGGSRADTPQDRFH